MPHEYPILPEFTTWPTFPFEGDLRIRPIDPPVSEEPPRQGEDPATCAACLTPDSAYLWVSARWRVRSPDRPTGLPMVLILEPRSHLDLGDLPNLLAAELGVMTVRLERAVRSLDGVARVHVNRWGDGSAHLNLWFLARPSGQLQLRGTFLSLWDDILPPVAEPRWRENTAYVGAWLAEFGGRSMVEPPHIDWLSPSSIDGPEDANDPLVQDGVDRPDAPREPGEGGAPEVITTDAHPQPRWTAVTSESPIYVPRQRLPSRGNVAGQPDEPPVTQLVPDLAIGDLGATDGPDLAANISGGSFESVDDASALAVDEPGVDAADASIGVGAPAGADEATTGSPKKATKAVKATKAATPRKAAGPRKAASPRKAAAKKSAAASAAAQAEPAGTDAASAPVATPQEGATAGTEADAVSDQPAQAGMPASSEAGPTPEALPTERSPRPVTTEETALLAPEPGGSEWTSSTDERKAEPGESVGATHDPAAIEADPRPAGRLPTATGDPDEQWLDDDRTVRLPAAPSDPEAPSAG